jgi:hypothetical protein
VVKVVLNRAKLKVVPVVLRMNIGCAVLIKCNLNWHEIGRSLVGKQSQSTEHSLPSLDAKNAVPSVDPGLSIKEEVTFVQLKIGELTTNSTIHRISPEEDITAADVLVNPFGKEH